MKELNRELLAVTDAVSLPENIVLSRNVRLTVLTERMIRVEFSPEGNFTDLPSQTVWYRNFGIVPFTHKTSNDTLTVKTEKAVFCVNCHTGAFKYAEIDGKKIKPDPEHNLKAPPGLSTRLLGLKS